MESKYLDVLEDIQRGTFKRESYCRVFIDVALVKLMNDGLIRLVGKKFELTDKGEEFI